LSRTIPDGGGAFKVMVYSPYIIQNRTGLDIDVLADGSKLFGTTQASGIGHERKGVAYMFSYPNGGKKNRARIKVEESDWSSPQSLDAIGSTYSVSLKSSRSRSQMSVGVAITEGEGKVSYKICLNWRN
jgi:vacuolar protein sorting-associated protein 13A/C